MKGVQGENLKIIGSGVVVVGLIVVAIVVDAIAPIVAI